MSAAVKKNPKKLAYAIIRILVIAIIIVFFLLPVYITLLYSFKLPTDIGGRSLSLPTSFYAGNYLEVITRNDAFTSGVSNSVLCTVPIVVFLTVMCSMASYILARNKGRIYNGLYHLFLTGLLVPFQCIMLPTYINLRSAGLMNTLTGYVIVCTDFQIAMSILVVTDFVKTVPVELEEAASIDGASPLQIFWRIIFPLMKPINVTMIVINILIAWNDFYISVVVLQSSKKRTLPLAQFVYIGEAGVDIKIASAFFMLCMIPMIIVYLFAQKYIVSGIMSGAVKG